MTNYHNQQFSSYKNELNTVFVYHHLGLGDHIVCNGLVRSIFRKDLPDFLFLPVKAHNHRTISAMYSDEPRIVCLPVKSDADVPHLSQAHHASRVYRAGFEKTRADWDVSFYDSVGISFSERWNSFKIERNAQRETELANSLNIAGLPYIVIHDTASIGKFNEMKVDNREMRTIRIEKLTDNLLDWCGVIEGCEEFHGIDSSVVHLAQSLNVKKGILHASTPTPPQINTSKNWSVVNYR
jgi:hypothetical protein